MMRRWVCLAILCAMAAGGFGQPAITNVTAPNTVDIYGKYELSFGLDDYDNPYDPEVIDVYAEFRSPQGETFRANGFYYEGYRFREQSKVELASRQRDNDGWKIRFTPDAVGRWTYTIHAVDRTGHAKLSALDGRSLAFECKAKDAEGFIRTANTRYLKREAFAGGERRDHAYFPVGPNVAWYTSADYHKYQQPYGIYDFQRYFNLLEGSANYVRIWLTRYQYLSLYGPEHTIREQGKPMVYFDSKLNQKDAAELDEIVNDAADHGLTLMLCFFTYGDLRDDSEDLEKSQQYGSMPSGWRYNPYHTVLKLRDPLEFFTDPEAIRITDHLVRYIVARWGYATHLTAWELFNEVGNIFKLTGLTSVEAMAINEWHRHTAEVIRECDPHRHLITTSIGYDGGEDLLLNRLYEPLDVVQDHFYDNIQKANYSKQMTYLLLGKSEAMRQRYPDKPCFMGEYGLDNTVSGINYQSRDPKGIDVHNSTWSSLFSGSMGPASFWYWTALDRCELFGRFKPITTFCNGLPVLSDNFYPATTGEADGMALYFPDKYQTYYLINVTEDTLYGWCQDEAFSYQALRRLTDWVGGDAHFVNDGIFDPQGYAYTLDESKKPRGAAVKDHFYIPVPHTRRGTRYQVRWFDAETGLEIPEEATTAVVRNRLFRGRILTLSFPASLRKGAHYENTFGDAVFMLIRMEDQ